ncbi:MAG: hypothetical protein DYH15_11405 [Nitrosomonas sp. PRO4]|nr:hypothetical protein [Nitrosomonas sp. PRO4]
MISNLIILVIVSIGIIADLPNIFGGFILSDMILILYISYLIKALFIYFISLKFKSFQKLIRKRAIIESK